MNHTSHINHIFVVHVKCTSSYGGGKRGSCEPKKPHEPQMGPPCVFCGSHEPQIHMVDPFVVYVNHKKHMNHKRILHVFFVVHVNHKITWWTHLWFM